MQQRAIDASPGPPRPERSRKHLVPREIGGRGVAHACRALIADARSEGLTIVPACSYGVGSSKAAPTGAICWLTGNIAITPCNREATVLP